MAKYDIVRPQGDDAPWSNDLDEAEDGSGPLFVGVEQRKRRPTVFLAEADNDLRREIGAGLRQEGYPVSESSSMRELEMDLTFAFLHGSESQLDALIVSGLRMPGQDDYAVARQLQKQAWCPPIVLAAPPGRSGTDARGADGTGIAGLTDRPLALSSVCNMLAGLLSRPGDLLATAH